MKLKIALVMSFVLSVLSLNSQGLWTQKANFGGGNRFGAVNFSIGNKGYMCAGADNGNFYDDLWEYDPQNDVWSQMASMTGIRESPVAFAVGNKGYVGMGYGMASLFYSDFWEWDQTNNSWTQIANYPGDGGVGSMAGIAFSINGKGYVGTGGGWAGGYHTTDEFWEYDPVNDTWTQKTSFPGNPRWFAVGFAIGPKGYLGTGNYSTPFSDVYYKDFWEYDPVTDVWTQKSDLSDSLRMCAVGFAIGSKGYIGVGSSTGAFGIFRTDFWEWDPTTDVWTRKADYPGAGRYTCSAFSIGTKGYLGMGGAPNTSAKQDFWEFDPNLVGIVTHEDVLTIEVYPNPASEVATFQFAGENEIRTIIVCDGLGREIWRKKSSESTVEFPASEFSPGVYFYRIEESGAIPAAGKLTIE